MSSNPTDERADIGRLFVQNERRIYGFIRSVVVDRAAAEDILQETASVIWQKSSDFRPGSNFLAWSLAIARLQVKRYQRQNRRDHLVFDDAFLTQVEDQTVADGDRLGEVGDALASCVAKLDANDRELLEQRYAVDQSTATLAKRLGRPYSSVYNALARIRRKLAECIQRTLAKEDSQ
ncbi:MAG: sigma-70 family RNA polymerase sigma factor [Pirellulales bacterium]|nr:sigma-70 family RNA polymerase sigma factor [Pirellulales bacterium]